MCQSRLCKYYSLTCHNYLFDNSNPHIPKVVTKKATKTATGFDKSVAMGDILVKFHLKQIDIPSWFDASTRTKTRCSTSTRPTISLH